MLSLHAFQMSHTAVYSCLLKVLAALCCLHSRWLGYFNHLSNFAPVAYKSLLLPTDVCLQHHAMLHLRTTPSCTTFIHTNQLAKLSSSHATHVVKAKLLHTRRSRTYMSCTAHHDRTLVRHAEISKSKTTTDHCVRSLLCCRLAEHEGMHGDGHGVGLVVCFECLTCQLKSFTGNVGHSLCNARQIYLSVHKILY